MAADAGSPTSTATIARGSLEVLLRDVIPYAATSSVDYPALEGVRLVCTALGSWVRDCMRLVPGGGWYPGDKVREP